ncbi:MAG: biotin/lipoyl-binding protein [Pirellulales bacterium]
MSLVIGESPREWSLAKTELKTFYVTMSSAYAYESKPSRYGCGRFVQSLIRRLTFFSRRDFSLILPLSLAHAMRRIFTPGNLPSHERNMKIPSSAACIAMLVILSLSACGRHEEEKHEEHHKVVVTNPIAKDVVVTQEYVCQIHSARHIEICALQDGYMEEIQVKEGQSVKKGDVMFRILPTLYQAKLDAEVAEVQLAQIKFDNSQRLYQQKVVSQPEVAMAQAELAKAQAKVALARAELNFTTIRASLRRHHGQAVMSTGEPHRRAGQVDDAFRQQRHVGLLQRPGSRLPGLQKE